jgi:hypothetical protein
MSFEPVIHRQNFSTFWSTGKAWGVYRQVENPDTKEIKTELDVLYGSLKGIKVS